MGPPYRSTLLHLGTLRGTGIASGVEGRGGPVAYEIDGYRERTCLSANGRIAGGAVLLGTLFEGGGVRLELSDGCSCEIALSDPAGDGVAEICVTGRLPDFGR